MDNLIGKQLGRYRIISQIGRGGMSEVYKAFQANLDRYVALKILPTYLTTDPDFVERFNQEAKLLASFRHKNILPVYDYGEDEGYLYLVMHFVEYATLADAIREKLLSLSQACKYVIDVASALDYAHERGIVHLDVKPSNILIDKQGYCYLGDFGTAKSFLSQAKGNFGGLAVGTPAYMSPEQSSGQQNLDGRSDIYSLGIVLYELVTGRVPFSAETPLAVIFKHIQDALPLPSMINPAIPESVEKIILKALAKNPADRYATAGEMTNALSKIMPSLQQQESDAKKTSRTIAKEKNRLGVFLCHSSSDKLAIRKLYAQLQKEEWIDPWLDEEKLLPGENWDNEIRKAVRDSNCVIVCLSRESVSKEGYVQKEIKLALDVADEKPEGTIFIIPLKLEECSVPSRLSALQWVNYFDNTAYSRLLISLKNRAQNLGIQFD